MSGKQKELNEALVAAVGLIAREVFGSDVDRYDEPKHSIHGTEIGNLLAHLRSQLEDS